MRSALICPHCHRPNWIRSPELQVTLLHVYARSTGRHNMTVTSREVADHFGISVANAHNRMRKLESFGYLREEGSEAAKGGGVLFRWEITQDGVEAISNVS